MRKLLAAFVSVPFLAGCITAGQPQERLVTQYQPVAPQSTIHAGGPNTNGAAPPLAARTSETIESLVERNPQATDDQVADDQAGAGLGMLSHPQDPQNEMQSIREGRVERDSVFGVSPLQGVHEKMNQWNDSLGESAGLNLGVSSNSMVQGLTGAIPGEDPWGVATTFDVITTWEPLNRGKPTKGQFLITIEGRWDYGTTGPMDLGPASLGSLGFTANTYAAYVPAFLPIRNMYWQQGSKEAGWVYRVGRITVDQIFSTSRHISPATTYGPISGTGPFAIALADSGWGASGAWYFTDRIGVLGAIHDANGNRQDFGDIGAGDFFKAIELGVKLAPRTEKAGYSKITFWHTDGTSDGGAINGSTGPPGWGFFIKLEQELTSDGRQVGLLRYGRSYNDSAMYRQLGAVHWLLYDPGAFGHIRDDVVGVAFNWVEPTNGVRDEYNWEIFYRFPTFTGFDTTLSYQAILHPSLDLGTDFSNVFSLRLRSVF